MKIGHHQMWLAISALFTAGAWAAYAVLMAHSPTVLVHDSYCALTCGEYIARQTNASASAWAAFPFAITGTLSTIILAFSLALKLDNLS